MWNPKGEQRAGGWRFDIEKRSVALGADAVGRLLSADSHPYMSQENRDVDMFTVWVSEVGWGRTRYHRPCMIVFVVVRCGSLSSHIGIVDIG